MSTFSGPLDLSDLNSWRGLRPGMTREAAMKVLEDADADLTETGSGGEWVLVEDWGFELTFDDHDRLLQIAVEDDEHLWAGKPVLEVPVHEALLAMQPVVAGAGWRPEDPVSDPHASPAGPGAPAATPGDATLLYEGTLWLPGPGLGLVMCGGTVGEIVWRQPSAVPKPFVSAVTPAQLVLSQTPDLGDHLRKLMTQEHRRGEQARGSSGNSAAQTLLNWIALAGLAALGVMLWGRLQEWRQAPMLPGRLVAVEQVKEKFLEDVFRVAYLDPMGRPQEAVLRRADFYVAPREPGEEVPLRYLAGPPPEVHGPAREATPVVEKFLPLLGMLGGGYLALSLLVKLSGRKKTSPEAD